MLPGDLKNIRVRANRGHSLREWIVPENLLRRVLDEESCLRLEPVTVLLGLVDDRLVEHRGLREHPDALHKEKGLREIASGGTVPKGTAELHVLHLPLDVLLGEIVG